MKRCPQCGTTMSFRTKADLIVWEGRSTTIEIEALWCDSVYCDEGILDGPALAKREAAYDTLRRPAP